MVKKLAYFLVVVVLASPLAAETALDRSEKQAAKANRTLKRLGDFLRGDVSIKAVEKNFVSRFKILAGPVFSKGNLRCSGAFILHKKREVTVHPVKELTKWRASYGLGIRRAKFKIVRVIPDRNVAGKFITEQLFEALVVGNGEQCEIHQYWRAEWQIESEKALLVSFHELSRSCSKLQGDIPIFEDRAAAVLKLKKGRESMLTRGANYWMYRLETALKPDFFVEAGLTVADVNGDGREDVYLCQVAGIPNQLFLQQPDGTFRDEGPQTGLDILENTTCALFVDFDNDGDQDVALGTASGLAIMENGGGGRFKLKSILYAAPYVFGLCAADYDADGLVDIYACQYYASGATREEGIVRGNFPSPYPIFDANNGGRNILMKNFENLVFKDVTADVGLEQSNTRYSFAAMWEDWDNDGDQDLYVVNDFGKNVYYQNNRGEFIDASVSFGLDGSSFGMGVTSADFNGDGWLDIHVSNMFSSAGNRVTHQPEFMIAKDSMVKKEFQLMSRGNTMLQNRGNDSFLDVSIRSGITVGRWSWASLSPDINNDGYDDLLVANGFVTGKKPDDL